MKFENKGKWVKEHQEKMAKFNQISESSQKNEVVQPYIETYKGYAIMYKPDERRAFIKDKKTDDYVEVIAKTSNSTQQNLIKAAKVIIDRGNINFGKYHVRESSLKNEDKVADIEKVKKSFSRKGIKPSKTTDKEIHFTIPAGRLFELENIIDNLGYINSRLNMKIVINPDKSRTLIYKLESSQKNEASAKYIATIEMFFDDMAPTQQNLERYLKNALEDFYVTKINIKKV